MIRTRTAALAQSVQRPYEKIMFNIKGVTRDDDSTRSHRALAHSIVLSGPLSQSASSVQKAPDNR